MSKQVDMVGPKPTQLKLAPSQRRLSRASGLVRPPLSATSCGVINPIEFKCWACHAVPEPQVRSASGLLRLGRQQLVPPYTVTPS